jgi:hypothetical protein
MNTIKLCGGLGNQLFQYAFGKAQMQNGIEVQFDNSWYQTDSAISPLRKYVLDKFQIEVPLGKKHLVKTIHEQGYDAGLLSKDGYNFSGYWQYPAYSENILPELKKELFIKKELFTRQFLCLREKIILDNYSVAVHVRRGDYLQLEGFPVQPLEYYQKAMKKVQGNFYVFSDDPIWCRENFKKAQFIHLNEYLDFELMRLCRHQIISRSSFSWWAAYLNLNYDKIVIAPRQQLECKVRQRAVNRENEIFDPKEWSYVD